MKKWENFMSLICAVIMALSVNTTSYAAYTDNQPAIQSFEKVTMNQENVFSMDMVSASNQGIVPHLTVTGSGGVSTLDYMPSGRCIAWSVTPATGLAYNFIGEISIYTYSTGTPKGVGLCSKFGIGTGSGIIDVGGLNLRRGTKYKAVFTGAATDLLGNIFKVSSSATIVFSYY